MKKHDALVSGVSAEECQQLDESKSVVSDSYGSSSGMSVDALTVERWVGEGIIKCAHIVLSSRIYRCSRTLPPRSRSNWVCYVPLIEHLAVRSDDLYCTRPLSRSQSTTQIWTACPSKQANNRHQSRQYYLANVLDTLPVLKYFRNYLSSTD
jgi:hypothetical protein